MKDSSLLCSVGTMLMFARIKLERLRIQQGMRMQVHNVHISRAVIRGQRSDRAHWLGPMQVVPKSRTSAFLRNLRNLKQKGLLLVITTAPACHPGPRQSSRSVALAKRITALRTRMVGKAFMRKRTPRNHETIMSRLVNSKVWSFSSVFKSFQRHQNMLLPTTTSR